MTSNILEISELLVSRLCHDIISPVSAIANGLELLEGDDGKNTEMLDQIIPLAKEGSMRALALLQYFRLSLGTGYRDKHIPLQEIKNTANQYFAGTKIQIIWPEKLVLLETKLFVSRLLLLTLINLPDAMPRGGVIKISESKSTLICELQAGDIRWTEDLDRFFAKFDAPDPLTTKKVLWALLAVYTRHFPINAKVNKLPSLVQLTYQLTT
ncbi:MAG: hypothetical protein IPP67_00975 [Rhodospirillaceae bacterium]|nr:hypothetical protein [Rhodospirillaceae bacterium]